MDAHHQQRLKTLLGQLQGRRLFVEWEVLPEGGPGWVGSSRSVTISIEEEPLADAALHALLADAVVAVVGIPETSREHLIQGEGEIRPRGDCLELDYECSATIPYQHPSRSDEGVKTLLRLGAGGSVER